MHNREKQLAHEAGVARESDHDFIDDNSISSHPRTSSTFSVDLNAKDSSGPSTEVTSTPPLSSAAGSANDHGDSDQKSQKKVRFEELESWLNFHASCYVLLEYPEHQMIKDPMRKQKLEKQSSHRSVSQKFYTLDSFFSFLLSCTPPSPRHSLQIDAKRLYLLTLLLLLMFFLNNSITDSGPDQRTKEIHHYQLFERLWFGVPHIFSRDRQFRRGVWAQNQGKERSCAGKEGC